MCLINTENQHICNNGIIRSVDMTVVKNSQLFIRWIPWRICLYLCHQNGGNAWSLWSNPVSFLEIKVSHSSLTKSSPYTRSFQRILYGHTGLKWTLPGHQQTDPRKCPYSVMTFGVDNLHGAVSLASSIQMVPSLLLSSLTVPFGCGGGTYAVPTILAFFLHLSLEGVGYSGWGSESEE